eukprot:snap_masked-scaffold_9-processed-gene-13.61-mRNA-1 protein AED:1.00 eAED:1.00 QI:0/-1/0/0/-1/1/1/0/68
MNETKRYLKVVYPNGWEWENVITSWFEVRKVDFARVEYDLDGKLVEVGWNIHQALLLKNLVMHFGFAK